MEHNNSRDKAGWKAVQLDYELVMSQSDRGCSYCLTDQQVTALLGMTEYLAWPTRWRRAAGDLDRDELEAFASGVEDALMSGCCDDNLPIQYRWLPDGTLQRSLNGGGAWVDAPEFDPRINSPQSPPLPDDLSDQVRCDMAASVAAAIEEQVGNQLTDEMSRYTLDELLQDWVTTYINFWDPFTALVRIAANQIFALVISALRAALTSEVYEQLKCLILDHMPVEGLWTAATAESLRAAVSAEIGGIAGQFLQHLIFLMGAVGLTNLSRSGFVAGADCSECEPPTCSSSFNIFCDVGSIVDITDEYLEVECAANPLTGGYGVALSTGNPDYCCYVVQVTNAAGTPISPLSAYRACGEPVPECGEAFGHANVYCQQTHTFTLYDLSDGYILRIYFSDEPCPP